MPSASLLSLFHFSLCTIPFLSPPLFEVRFQAVLATTIKALGQVVHAILNALKTVCLIFFPSLSDTGTWSDRGPSTHRRDRSALALCVLSID